MEYLTEIQVYKNISIPIDTFVFHYGLSQWYQALVVRSIRRVLKKIYNMEIPLIETFDKIKEKYKEVADKLVENVKTNERYLGKTIIPINISCVVKEEEPPQEEQGQNNNGENNNNQEAQNQQPQPPQQSQEPQEPQEPPKN